MKRIKAKRLLFLTICYAALTACASKDLQIDTISFEQEAQYGYTAHDSSEDEVNLNKTAEEKISQNEVSPNETAENRFMMSEN